MQADALVRRHLAFGWWTLALFLLLGLTLEGLHAFKVRYYLDTDNETRRLMWRLAHAHGGLLGLVHLGFGLTARVTGRASAAASSALVGATVLIPGGFFVGGVWIQAGDPGYGALLIPPGALLLLFAVVRAALSLRAPRGSDGDVDVDDDDDDHQSTQHKAPNATMS